jgi:hypothetical protein
MNPEAPAVRREAQEDFEMKAAQPMSTTIRQKFELEKAEHGMAMPTRAETIAVGQPCPVRL